jgi:hypothetical protein
MKDVKSRRGNCQIQVNKEIWRAAKIRYGLFFIEEIDIVLFMENFMQKLIPALLFPVLLFAACSSGPKKSDSGLVGKTKTFEIIEWSNEATGGKLPEWVERFDNDGIYAVEALDRYKDKYVFISKDTGKKH